MQRLLGILLVSLLLTACGPSGPPAPTLTEEMAIDILWRYEATHITVDEKLKLVTGNERIWFERLVEDVRAGRQPRHVADWGVNGSVAKLEKVTAKEAFVTLQYMSPSLQKTVVISLRLVPEEGVWKLENHQTPDGRWWKP